MSAEQVRMGVMKLIGIRTSGSREELATRVPKAWSELASRLGEIENVVDPGVFFGVVPEADHHKLEGQGSYTYLCCARVKRPQRAVGKYPNDWHDVDTILSHFGRRLSSARNGYRSFVEQAVAVGQRPELTGGGLIRSVGGWGALKRLSKGKLHLKGDERILGDRDFVQAVLEAQNEKLERRYRRSKRRVLTSIES